MKGYILSILGVVLIGMLVDVVLPDGKINKYIKTIYSIFVLAVIIAPITNILKSSKFYYSVVLKPTSANVLYDDMIKAKENYIETVLENNGIKNLDVNLQYDLKNDDLNIYCCKVFTKDLVIDPNGPHIIKYDYIRKIIKDCTGLCDEEIEFDE